MELMPRFERLDARGGGDLTCSVEGSAIVGKVCGSAEDDCTRGCVVASSIVAEGSRVVDAGKVLSVEKMVEGNIEGLKFSDVSLWAETNRSGAGVRIDSKVWCGRARGDVR